MNWTYNHIKHLVDTNDEVKSSNRHCRHGDKHEANQLDGKQQHSGFDYYEYDMLKFVTSGCAQSSLDRSRLDFQEHLEDLEHDQACYQGIHGHGRRVTW